jgi:hypothetical protein
MGKVKPHSLQRLAERVSREEVTLEQVRQDLAKLRTENGPTTTANQSATDPTNDVKTLNQYQNSTNNSVTNLLKWSDARFVKLLNEQNIERKESTKDLTKALEEIAKGIGVPNDPHILPPSLRESALLIASDLAPATVYSTGSNSSGNVSGSSIPSSATSQKVSLAAAATIAASLFH